MAESIWNRFRRGLGIAVLGSLLPITAAAEQLERFGAYDVHYVALHASDLAPSVAAAYGIQRSANRGVIVLHARQNTSEGSRSVPVAATVRARNLIGQERGVTMRNVEDQGTHYAIGSFSVSHRERFTFFVDVDFGDRRADRSFRFTQEFHTR